MVNEHIHESENNKCKTDDYAAWLYLLSYRDIL